MRRLILIFLLFAGKGFATDLRVTDSTSTVIVVHEPFIDYGGLMGDKELDGIRLYQGEAVVTAKWVNIRSVTITGKETTGKDTPPTQARLKAEIVPKKGAKIS